MVTPPPLAAGGGPGPGAETPGVLRRSLPYAIPAILVFLGLVAIPPIADKKVTVTVIWVNGVQVGKGSYDLKIKDGDQALVMAREPGYVTESITFFNDKAHPAPPKLYPMTLVKDPLYESSASTDIVNKDIDVQTRRNEEEAWRLITQIVSGAFDVMK